MNKYTKTAATVLVIYSLFSIIAPIALAQPTSPAGSMDLKPDCNPVPGEPDSCTVDSFIKFIKKIITVALTIAIPLGIIFISYGAFVIMTAGGNPGRVDQGKEIITASVIGLAIAFGSYMIITALNYFLETPIFK